MRILAVLFVLLSTVTAFAEPTHQALSWTLEIKEHSDAALKQLDDQLAGARGAGEPVMIDLFADWCAACRVFEHDALSNADVIRALTVFIKIRVDVTEPDEFTDAIRKRFNANVLPTVTFVSRKGKFSQVAGAMPAQDFVAKVKAVH